MTSAVCTLFEGDYHCGLGALVNSLYAHGFRGTIYAGYRGALPPWAINIKKHEGFSEFKPTEGITLRFIPLTTKAHFTNYKADLMLEIWEKHDPELKSLFYFDPDIIIKCRWAFFEEWAEAGVALCTDVNPSMPANHPIRHAWKQFYLPHGIEFRQELDAYFNGGFIGISLKNKEFLKLWKILIQKTGDAVGGLERMVVGERSEKFCILDQDALNIAAMSTTLPISSMGQDGMDFQQGGGGYVMTHAAGGVKPWRKKMLKEMIINGSGPSGADKKFYSFSRQPIKVFSTTSAFLRKIDLLLASAIGRYIG
jgi:hypothetical protein